MIKYPKINSLFKRDDNGKFKFNEYSTPEFEYLSHNKWIGTEKIDGTNIRIHWDGEKVELGGRTENTQIPAFLVNRLQDMVEAFKWDEVFENSNDITLFGEGYGNRIQKVGKLYKSDGVDFILFDVKIGDWWLKRKDVEEVAGKLGIQVVTEMFYGDLYDAIEFVKNGFQSTLGNLEAEGLVLLPEIQLFNRKGERIVTKL